MLWGQFGYHTEDGLLNSYTLESLNVKSPTDDAVPY